MASRPNRTRRRKRAPQHTSKVIASLHKALPVVVCELIHHNAYELLVATILSAQCTDERVNQVTPELFAAFPTPSDLAQATQEQVETIIHSLGFFRAKATNLRLMAQKLVEDHGGDVPQDLEALCQLAGVGRKTANVVLGVWFHIPTGVVVDTHVKRISRLIGLTKEETPERIEQDLMDILPEEEWIDFSHRLIRLGRSCCVARRPKCLQCPLLDCCRRVGLPKLSQ